MTTIFIAFLTGIVCLVVGAFGGWKLTVFFERYSMMKAQSKFDELLRSYREQQQAIGDLQEEIDFLAAQKVTLEAEVGALSGKKLVSGGFHRAADVSKRARKTQKEMVGGPEEDQDNLNMPSSISTTGKLYNLQQDNEQS